MPDDLTTDLGKKQRKLAGLLSKLGKLTAAAPGPQPQPADPNRVYQQKDVARHFGVSARTVRHWLARGMPHGESSYDLAAIQAWLHEQGLHDQANDETSGRARILALDAQIKEIKLQKLRGELVPVDAVRRLFVRHVHEAKAIFEQVPDRVVAALPTATVKKTRQKVQREAGAIVRAACQSLSDMLTAAEGKEG